jgi:hypothetical protein
MPVRARSTSSATLVLGQGWLLDVCVTDLDGCPVADTITFTVTDPAEATSVPTVETVAGETGRYRAVYVPAEMGRFVAVAAGALYGAVAFTAWVGEISTGADLPDITELDAYLGTNGATSDELQEALDAEAQAQRDRCTIPAVYPDSLRSALLRRCARHLAMKRIPLAVIPGSGDAEAGPTMPPGRDPEVRRLEAPYPKLGMG